MTDVTGGGGVYAPWIATVDFRDATLWRSPLVADLAADIPGWEELRTADDRIEDYRRTLDAVPATASLEKAASALLTGPPETVEKAVGKAVAAVEEAGRLETRYRVLRAAETQMAGDVGTWMWEHNADLATALTKHLGKIVAAARKTVHPTLDGIHNVEELSRLGGGDALQAWQTLTTLGRQFGEAAEVAGTIAGITGQETWDLLEVFGDNYAVFAPDWPWRIEATIRDTTRRNRSNQVRIIPPAPNPFAKLSPMERLRVAVDRDAAPDVTSRTRYRALREDMTTRAHEEHHTRSEEAGQRSGVSLGYSA